MIDLRSDTLTLPSAEMRREMLTAPLGDAGRQDSQGWGGDPTVNALERAAAEITGKERALFLPSGTLGNLTALLTYCRPGDTVLVDTKLHIYRSEKAAFDPRFGQLVPAFYELTPDGYPDVGRVREKLKAERPALLCVENTHNGAGGTCIPLPALKELREAADETGIPIHLDGARLFNAAVASGVEAGQICGYVDSVMFCISKGLGAPVGSLLCGKTEFILAANATRKLLGGNMRQSGVLAAAGLYALKNNIPSLAEDHRRARELASLLGHLRAIRIVNRVQSNMILLDASPLGLSADEYIGEMKRAGVWMSTSGETAVRIVLYRGVSDEQVKEAAERVLDVEKRLLERR